MKSKEEVNTIVENLILLYLHTIKAITKQEKLNALTLLSSKSLRAIEILDGNETAARISNESTENILVKPQ